METISGHFLFQLLSHQKKKLQLYQMEINEYLLLHSEEHPTK